MPSRSINKSTFYFSDSQDMHLTNCCLQVDSPGDESSKEPNELENFDVYVETKAVEAAEFAEQFHPSEEDLTEISPAIFEKVCH